MGLDNIFEDMSKKLLDAVDPDNPYTQEDFDKEFKDVGTSTIVVNEDRYKLPFLFANKSNNPDPEYATTGSSGFDIRADLSGGSHVMKPHTTAIIPTGLFFELPENYEIQVRPRSGLAAKNGVTVLNSPGTIDADYRGEIKVILINHSNFDFPVLHGDRIAQCVIAPALGKNVINLIKIDNISEDTERGSGGFGSTGLQ